MATTFLDRFMDANHRNGPLVSFADGIITVADTTSAQTLTNKTLTAPVMTAPVITGAKETVLVPVIAFVLTAAQSGISVMLGPTAGFAITLPTVAAGLWYRFTVAAAFATTNYTVITPALANLIQGGALVAGLEVPGVDEDTISFVATAESIGDFVEVWSDGTSWFANGRGALTGAITFTQAG